MLHLLDTEQNVYRSNLCYYKSSLNLLDPYLYGHLKSGGITWGFAYKKFVYLGYWTSSFILTLSAEYLYILEAMCFHHQGSGAEVPIVAKLLATWAS
jgi:hypothetical protein